MLCKLLSVALSVAVIASSDDLSWTYSNQAAWADLENSQCGASSGQSPINIKTANSDSVECPSSSDLDWSLNENELSFTVSNSGSHHNIKVLPRNTGDKYNLAKLKNNFRTSSHEYYCLDSFHMHWGSEHTINNVRSELEIHFVHYSCDYDSLSEATDASSTDPYTLAVVAVLFETGKVNTFLKSITDRITSLQSPGQSITIRSSTMTDLFNVDLGESFYHYKGSLTTPTCDPIVSWHVMKNKMQLTAAQAQSFRTIIDTDNSAVVSNYRDVQPASSVYLCGEGDSD
jgi:carbonic anhydrase